MSEVWFFGLGTRPISPCWLTLIQGTNTDSAIVDLSKAHDLLTRGVIASFKHKTTPDVTDGIEAAVRRVLLDAGIDGGTNQVLSLTIGTTVSGIPL